MISPAGPGWLLLRSSRRYGERHPAQVLLCLLGIALGVAVVVAVDIALVSSQRSFRHSVASIQGTTTHRVVSTGVGVDESTVRELKVAARIQRVAPVIDEFVRVRRAGTSDPPTVVRLLGIDPFAESSVRSWDRVSTDSDAGRLSPGDLVSQAGTAWIEVETASELGFQLGDAIEVRAGARNSTVELLDQFRAPTGLDQARAQRLLLVDISTAQEILGRFGVVSRLDLELTADEAERVRESLPPECRLELASAQSNTLDQMTRAFQLNLRCLSLLALVVGWFLIYNSMAFSVVQRAGLFSRLRAWGLGAPTLFRWILGEAAVIGVVATAIGILGGLALGYGLVHAVTATLSDLYLRVEVTSVTVSWLTLGKGIALGVGTTLLGAWRPAREASRARPTGLRSRLEGESRRKAPRRALLGLALILVALVATQLESRSLTLGYATMLAVILGFALIVPAGVCVMVALIAPMVRPLGPVVVMAPRNVVRHLSRTGLAIAALTVAVSMSLGVQVMIGSFRQSVVDWLETSVVADLYVSSPGVVARKGSEIPLPESLVAELEGLPGVAEITTQRLLTVPTDRGEIRIAVRRAQSTDRLGLELLAGDPEDAWPAYEVGDGLLVSEPFAYRFQLALGDLFRLATPGGPIDFPVVGIFRDFASDEGYVAMSEDGYTRYWPAPGVTGVAIFLSEASDRDSVSRAIDAIAARSETGGFGFASSGRLREQTLIVFDRTFAVTDVLRWLAILVAWVGVFSALLALQLERRREFAVLRSRGLMPRQATGLVIGESSLMGLFAGLLAIPLGVVLAWILTEVVSRRSFGWTLGFQLDPWEMASALSMAVAAGFASGLWPGFRLARQDVVSQLRGRDE